MKSLREVLKYSIRLQAQEMQCECMWDVKLGKVLNFASKLTKNKTRHFRGKTPLHGLTLSNAEKLQGTQQGTVHVSFT